MRPLLIGNTFRKQGERTMNITPKIVKRTLKKTIREISSNPQNFARNPQKDFCRNRKLPFEKMMYSILSMSSKDLKCELLDFFDLDKNIPTVSAFVQQRNKISVAAFETLFHKFTKSFPQQKLYKGYRLLAVDGSDLHTPTNPQEDRCYYPGTNGQKPYNLMHLNAMYDLLNNIYVDAVVQGSRDGNENRAFVSMVDKDTSPLPTIYIADRGYESYNNLAHIQEKGQKFLIRVKDLKSNGIVSGLSLPTTDEFDENFSFLLTRKQTKDIKQNTSFKFVPHNVNFDYLPSSCKKKIPVIPYQLNVRLVRIKLDNDKYEVLITNLKPEEFSSSDLKELYSMRWGIETSFRSLKYTLGLLFFHSKKVEYILQEIFAKLTMYNFTELITSHVVIKQKGRKLSYKINFSASVHICRNFLLKNISPPEIEALISKFLVPIKNNINNPRKISTKTAVCFLYRVA